MRPPSPPKSRRADVQMALMLLVLGLGACLDLRGRPDVPPHRWWDERGPVVPHDSFPADCSTCHTSETWEQVRDDFSYDHLAETGVALLGAHATAECLRCHNDRGPAGLFAARGCAGCHEDVHQGMLGDQCTTCHSENDWNPVGQVAEHSRTRFPLVGAHASTACFACHENAQAGRFDREDVACESCHAADLAQATVPNHLAQGWTDRCDRCHVPVAWTGAGFSHTFFPLVGGHAAADCSDCHEGGVYAGTPTDCVACHEADYGSTVDPNHVVAGFPSNCQQCHTVAGWTGAAFKHTFFPLTGAHATTDCLECHQGGVFEGTPTDCIACHQDEYDGTNDPPHVANGFSTNCLECHNTSDWGDANFDHDFPIESGKHKNLDCIECHVVPGNSSVFSCIDCHEHSQGEMAGEHDEVNGYSWNSQKCLQCHPKGKE